jgi:glutamyl-Q tRNA(Asp) synthetase
MTFITRFAPSPTGPLHLGHAYSAILAHDMARAAGGRFLLRMEDTDLDRAKPEWDALIQDDLRWLGLDWDGPILRQSDHLARYNASLEPLETQGLLYPCSCTRADIRAALSAPQEGVTFNLYPGTCRHRPMSDRQPGDALRLNLAAAFDALETRTTPEEQSRQPRQSLPPPPRGRAGVGGNPVSEVVPLTFEETGLSHAGLHRIIRTESLARIGDVVLSRKGEDIVAYFLASALDDAEQGVTHVIRGEDLFDFTPIQVILQRLLGLPTPTYHHHRLIRDDQGKRLAKRDDARAIAKYRAEGATPADIRRMVGLPEA